MSLSIIVDEPFLAQESYMQEDKGMMHVDLHTD